MNNWANEIISYPLPDQFPRSYVAVIKDKIMDHVSNGGKVTDERSAKIFLILCRMVDTFNQIKIDWDKKPNDYLTGMAGEKHDHHS